MGQQHDTRVLNHYNEPFFSRDLIVTPPGAPQDKLGNILARAAPAPITLGASWDQGAQVINGPITLVRKAPVPFTISGFYYDVGSVGGGFTVSVQINGVAVGGPAGNFVVNTTTDALVSASAPNTVNAGDKVTFLISSVSGAPTNSNLQLVGTRT